MRIHILGIPHTKTTKEFSPCPFTQNTRILSRMLTEMGHTVFHYGNEGSNPICTENISILSDTLFQKEFGWINWRHGFFDNNNQTIKRTFTKNAIREINKRKEVGDFLFCTFGDGHKEIAESAGEGLYVVEPNIGYSNVFAEYKIFTTYNWMHYIYGTLTHNNHQNNQMLSPICQPSFRDTVIPYPFELDDVNFSKNKEDYFIFVGRLVYEKGLSIAVDVCEKLNKKLIVIGQSDAEGIVENYLRQYDFIEYSGVADIEKRNELFKSAKGTFVPTIINEPFGMVVIESLLSGTPVITTDHGSFAELVPHGVVGYRCKLFYEFLWAADNIDKIDPEVCHEYAKNNFSVNVLSKKFEHYLNNIITINESEGWYSLNTQNDKMDWLKLNNKMKKMDVLGDVIYRSGHRIVFNHKTDENLVVKVTGDENNTSPNRKEFDCWLLAKKMGLDDWLVPCIDISDDGYFIFQQKGEPIEDDEIPKNIPDWLKPDSDNSRQWVKIDGKVRKCDYDHGEHRLLNDLNNKIENEGN